MFRRVLTVSRPSSSTITTSSSSSTRKQLRLPCSTSTNTSSTSISASATTCFARRYAASAAAAPPSADAPKVYVVYYSCYGHVATMADHVAKGAQSAGADVKVFQAAETLPEELLKKIGAAPKRADHPVIRPDQLAEPDAIIFGTPTRFGMGASQLKALLDATGGLWAKGGLHGKVGSVFFSTGTLGGGQETTALTWFTQMVHHGMIIVPIGYGNPALANLDEVHGGSPYGAGCLAGADGRRQPSALETALAEYQGKHVATVAGQLKKGRK